MADLLFVVITIAFCVLCVGYVHVCDRIIGPDPRLPDDAGGRGAQDEEREVVPEVLGS